VTVVNRDTTEQVRVPIDGLVSELRRRSGQAAEEADNRRRTRVGATGRVMEGARPASHADWRNAGGRGKALLDPREEQPWQIASRDRNP